MSAAPRVCDTHTDLFNFSYELPHFAESLKKQGKINVVAIGSSSTAGEGDVVPYPARLATLLQEHFRNPMIDVLNRGIGGQEATTELLRFQPDVLDKEPALVIWQVGTNAVFRHDEFDFADVIDAIAMGLRRLAEHPIDVVIMDSQYVPAVVDGGKLKLSEELLGMISGTAKIARVNVFRRFDLMRHWVAQDGIPIEELVREGDEKKLHMSDWATNCVTQALFQSIRRVVEAAGAT